MIKEAYVSFEIAKLLKKKGFCERCFICYEQGGEVFEGFGNWNKTDIYIAAPTLQMACAWLREKHNVDIVTFHERLPNDVYWSRIEKYPYTEHQQEPIYKKYEEAVEAALKYVLENLI